MSTEGLATSPELLPDYRRDSADYAGEHFDIKPEIIGAMQIELFHQMSPGASDEDFTQWIDRYSKFFRAFCDNLLAAKTDEEIALAGRLQSGELFPGDYESIITYLKNSSLATLH